MVFPSLKFKVIRQNRGEQLIIPVPDGSFMTQDLADCLALIHLFNEVFKVREKYIKVMSTIGIVLGISFHFIP